ncbi:hypothetical protein RBB78_03385 [Tunturiibacter empetritectus]|uniref:hypothetical protein n=1 Tax=Tunturiibacter empetritectus TaxID=3069691 RepID=UPI003D9BEFC1
MATEEPKRSWEQPLRDAATHLETDLKNVVKYINDEVVPGVRRNSSEALRTAAAELHKARVANGRSGAPIVCSSPATTKGRAEAVMRFRLGTVAVLSACALTISGCHKETTRAYRPPPPPAGTTASSHGKTLALRETQPQMGLLPRRHPRLLRSRAILGSPSQAKSEWPVGTGLPTPGEKALTAPSTTRTR